MSAHTPAPWRVNKYGSIGAGERGTEPIVAHVEPFFGADTRFGDHAANARLIAAAPDLLAALKGMIASNRVFRTSRIGAPGSERRMEQEAQIAAEDAALAAVARAEGRQP